MLLRLRLAPWLHWVNRERAIALSVLLLQAVGYMTIAKAVSLKIAEEVGEAWAGLYLSANAALSLVVYPIVGALVKNSRKVLFVALPVSIGMILLMTKKEWLPVIWVLFGPVSAVIYTAADGLFQRSLESTEQEKCSKAAVQLRRLNTSFKISSFIYYLAVALAGLVGLWLSENHLAWILFAGVFMVAGLILLRGVRPTSIVASESDRKKEKSARTSDRKNSEGVRKKSRKRNKKRKRQKRRNRQRRLTKKRRVAHQKRVAKRKKRLIDKKERNTRSQKRRKVKDWLGKWQSKFVLYTAALPYLASTITNATVNVAVPIYLDPFAAGLVLFVHSITNALGYLWSVRSTRRAYIYLGSGVLLFPLGLGIGDMGLPLYLIGGAVIGAAVSQCKLVTKTKLFSLAGAQKEKASAALSFYSEAGYVLGPLLLGLSYLGGSTVVWLVAGLLPLIAAVTYIKGRKKEDQRP